MGKKDTIKIKIIRGGKLQDVRKKNIMKIK